MNYEPHEYCSLFPALQSTDLASLREDVQANGLLEPITIFEGKILDGRNRAGVCADLGIEPETVEFHGDNAAALSFVISKNLNRRHLNESQRALVAERLANIELGANQHTMKEGSANSPILSQDAAAKKLNVSPRSIRTAKAMKQTAAPEVIKAVEDGSLSLNAAAKIAELSEKDQKKVMLDARPDQAVKKVSRANREAQLAAKQKALPSTTFGVIYADPEWKFETFSENGMDRSADNHYPTSDTKTIMARDVASIAADDCVLFLWATAPMLPDALLVMESWGFTYKSQAVWVKDRIGTGYWLRNQHEILLIGTKGAIPAPAPGSQWASVIEAPVAAHSEKPEEAYRLIEEYFPTLPKTELNARNARDGWTAWGLEAPEAEAAE